MSQRHLKGVLIIFCLLVAATTLRIALEWRQALLDIETMMVTPVTLPTSNGDEPSGNTLATEATPAPSTLMGDASSEGVQEPIATPVEGRETTDELVTTLPTGDVMNILLLGTDARPEDTGPTRTDAIVLVRLDRTSGNVSMLSLPRDLWVEYPGIGTGRINGAFGIGESEFGPGGGPALAKATVGELLNLKVDNFILIDFAGFETLIDRLGGISVDVPRDIYDPAYPTADYGTMEVFFPEGVQRLNGEDALIYARTRHADSDFGRNQRQQQVLMAIFDRVRERGLLQQITSLDDYTGALRGYVQTDLNHNSMITLANWGRTISLNDIRQFAIDSSAIVELQPPATFAPEERALRRIIGQFTGSSSTPAGGETTADDE